MEQTLKEGVDFYYDQNGLMVLTKAYLLKRGRCCQSGCQNCPYGYGEKVDPNIPSEFQSQESHGHQDPQSPEIPEIYEGEIPDDFL